MRNNMYRPTCVSCSRRFRPIATSFALRCQSRTSVSLLVNFTNLNFQLFTVNLGIIVRNATSRNKYRWGDWKCKPCQMQYHENDGPNRRGWKMQDQSDFEINAWINLFYLHRAKLMKNVLNGHVRHSFRTVWAEARMSTGDKSNSW